MYKTRLYQQNATIPRNYSANHLALQNAVKVTIMIPRQVVQELHVITLDTALEYAAGNLWNI